MVTCPLSPSPSLDKQSLYVAGFFRTFLFRNSFTGRSWSYCLSIQGHLAYHESLSDVVSAIGALRISRFSRSQRHEYVRDALRL